ncbi:sigma-54-dependent Fis family transcriptional regulator [Fulvivirga sp. M361]|uniref:sigma-54-dependent transcriptional regulator n=1 Tax=Fulvivirga sp. M361 TaxID=2594266 RepID=UPI00117A2FBF|nr:sigma-54 dependent transcriptional regulator [Fulvivirga sp. M361]TRX60489.1 sigma-54-dependent Fis family transcriptional regulator [Fulvivirga sp. M361]
MNKILIIDDDKDICRLLVRFLTKNGFEAESAITGDEALKLLKVNQYDLVLSDYKLPDANGVELLRKIKILNPNTAVIIITGYSDIKIAVEALRHGAYDYVTKPLYPDEILLKIKEAINSEQVIIAKSKETKKRPNTANRKKFIYGHSPQAEQVQKHVDLIAPTDMSVIIMGETGTGKEFIAKAVHEKSKRSDKPFVAIDCGAIPKDLAGSELFGHMKGAFTGALADKQGSFEVADGGTLFLDEIGNLSYDNQIKLLRVLQERKIKRLGSNKDISIDVRVIVATNENLREAVRDHKFREDIYHRLNEFKIELSPLRERPEDVLVFAEHFLKVANDSLDKNVQSFSKATQDKLTSYYWHGNLRELQNVIKRAVLLCDQDVIKPEHLPEELVHPEFMQMSVSDSVRNEGDENLKGAAKNAQRAVILDALKKAGYNKTKAAKALNIDRKTLYNKLKAYDISI